LKELTKTPPAIKSIHSKAWVVELAWNFTSNKPKTHREPVQMPTHYRPADT